MFYVLRRCVFNFSSLPSETSCSRLGTCSVFCVVSLENFERNMSCGISFVLLSFWGVQKFGKGHCRLLENSVFLLQTRDRNKGILNFLAESLRRSFAIDLCTLIEMWNWNSFLASFETETLKLNEVLNLNFLTSMNYVNYVNHACKQIFRFIAVKLFPW